MKTDFFGTTHQVFIYYAITRCKESQDVRYKISLVGLQGFPMLDVLGKIHLKCTRSQGIQACRTSYVILNL